VIDAPEAPVLEACAKLNLGLRVVGRRADGYHLIASVFVPLDLSDRLWISIEPGAARAVTFRLRRPAPDLECGSGNLAARAARAFLDAGGVDARVGIELEKRIPVGAGLGGGSSDAAAVLGALSRRFPGALPSATLLPDLALRLGADVPFFLDPRPARVGGIGERIEPLPGFPSLAVLVATPAPALATAEVYQAWDAGAAALTPPEPNRTMPRPPGLDDLPALLANDLEPVATRLRPGIARIRSALTGAGARAVGMSGSGPTVFGVFGAVEEARVAAAAIGWAPADRIHVGRTEGSP
jgi:4-diphosphocytidyl-2-C-methyl-D-erythritol kinase